MQHRRLFPFAVVCSGIGLVGATPSCAGGDEELGQSGPAASAASTGGPTGPSTTSGPGSGTGSSSGGSGGDGGSGASGGGGGTGGQGGEGGLGGAGGSSGQGGAPMGGLLLLAAGGNALLAGDFDPASGWATMAFAEGTQSGVAVIATDPGAGIGLVRGQNAGELRYLTWSAGVWSAVSGVAMNVTTRDRPSLASSGDGVAHAVFQGDDFKHYLGSFDQGWSPVAEPVGGIGPSQSFGPAPAGSTAAGADVVVAFGGDNGDLFHQTRQGGVWSAASAHNLGDVVAMTPAIVPLTQGTDLLVVFVEKNSTKLRWTMGSGVSWTVPGDVDMALTNDPPSLAALPNGRAVLAFRGTDSKVYASRFDANAAPPWSAPSPIAVPNYTTLSSPAVAAGVAGQDAELVFVDDATDAVHHSRLLNSTWSPPAPIGGAALVHVALARLP